MYIAGGWLCKYKGGGIHEVSIYWSDPFDHLRYSLSLFLALSLASFHNCSVSRDRSRLEKRGEKGNNKHAQLIKSGCFWRPGSPNLLIVRRWAGLSAASTWVILQETGTKEPPLPCFSSTLTHSIRHNCSVSLRLSCIGEEKERTDRRNSTITRRGFVCNYSLFFFSLCLRYPELLILCIRGISSESLLSVGRFFTCFWWCLQNLLKLVPF